jgi:hypothetical protein
VTIVTVGFVGKRHDFRAKRWADKGAACLWEFRQSWFGIDGSTRLDRRPLRLSGFQDKTPNPKEREVHRVLQACENLRMDITHHCTR